MKKLMIFLLTAAVFSGCYTTFNPPVGQQIEGVSDIPDSTRQIIINNYYETTEYYQVPYYQRYNLLWGTYVWDPFYYDYSYYHWRPYYWYGNYYYYNPHRGYWVYYDHHYHRHPRYRPSPWTGGGGSGGSANDQERIQKPGYRVLEGMSGSATPFVSVEPDIQRIGRPGSTIGPNAADGIGSSAGTGDTSPMIQSVGKRDATSTSSGEGTSIRKTSPSDTGSSTPAVKSDKPSTTGQTRVTTPSSTRVTKTRQSAPAATSKQSSTTSSTTKSSSSEQSTENNKSK